MAKITSYSGANNTRVSPYYLFVSGVNIAIITIITNHARDSAKLKICFFEKFVKKMCFCILAFYHSVLHPFGDNGDNGDNSLYSTLIKE